MSLTVIPLQAVAEFCPVCEAKTFVLLGVRLETAAVHGLTEQFDRIGQVTGYNQLPVYPPHHCLEIPMTAVLPKIAISNESTVLTDTQVQAVIPPLQNYVTYYLRPAWNTMGNLVYFLPKGSTPQLDSRIIHILDTSDQAGALGYHDVDANGLPISKVFAKTDLQYGADWLVTLTHELAEMQADPYINLGVQDPRTGYFWALEVGDPVEADGLGITVSGRRMSNFILPTWFIHGSKGPWDAGGHCTGPYQVLSGGYVSIWNGTTWTQKQMQDKGLVDVATSDPDDNRLGRAGVRGLGL